jgi:hypothetical protein
MLQIESFPFSPKLSTKAEPSNVLTLNAQDEIAETKKGSLIAAFGRLAG